MAEVAIAFLDLLEVEGRSLQQGVVKAAIAVSLVVVGSALAVAAVGLMLSALYLLLVGWLTPAAAAALTAIAAASMAAGVVAAARRMVR